MEPVLAVDGLRFRRTPERNGQASFEIWIDALRLAPGQVVGIVGPSGCGKSTLIDLLALLRRPSELERFEMMGTDVAALWRAGAVDRCTALRARHVGVVLQTGGLLPSLPVIDNVMLSQQLLGAPDRDHAQALIAELDLDGLQSRLPSQLSIGQRQRVAIARALAHRPPLVLADEPTASLGADHAAAALALLLRLSKNHGAALVIVSHDVELLREHGVPMRSCRMHGSVVELEAA